MQNKQCSQCNKTFQIYPEDLEFYQKINVPQPTLCPNCRQQRRLSWCNEMVLYPTVCKLCSKNILTAYAPNSNIRVTCRDCWWSDKYDAMEHGQVINWQESFFQQFNKLNHQVMHVATNTAGRLENCDYVHYCGDSKNCYLTFHADFNENSMYSYGLKKSKDCVDAYNNNNCELCYECIDCFDCYNLKWSQDCVGCYDSFFLKDCVGCRNCFGAVGLRNAEYYYFDMQLSKQEYQEKIKKIDLGSYQEIEKKLLLVKKYQETKFYKYCQGNKNENCTGNNLYKCKNLKNSFDCESTENGNYCYQLSLNAKDCYDLYQYGFNTELIYEGTILGGNCYNLKFCNDCFSNSQNLEYCLNCSACKNCFGCISLKHKEYCVLNKQYTKSEYLKLIEKLILKMKKDGEYGENFPSNISPFGYNETYAKWWFPLSKEGAKTQKFNWQDALPETKGKETLLEIPKNIRDVQDNIIKEILKCDHCQKNYKIIAQELEFYKKNIIPLPKNCFYCRHAARFNKRNPRALWHRQCMKPDCHNVFETTYSPNRKELVYCEDCYKKEIY